MTSPDQTDDTGVTRDDPMIAAEWALGLLEGEELMAARGKAATDPDFAWRKDWWDDWFAPLTDAIPGAEPGPHVWDGITAHITAQPHPGAVSGLTAGNVTVLETRVRRWQWVAGLTSAAAAVMLALFLFVPGQPPSGDAPSQIAAAPIVATMPIGDSGLRLDVTYMPEVEKMLVSAIGLTADGVHDHELWLVSGDGSAMQSLGIVDPGAVRSLTLPRTVTANLNAGARVVLTREPIGGKPAGAEPGPVVADAAFNAV
ncbi:anti-sigma factor domain-containing protein [Erythrobacter sp. R86502]|uniref:anti-sigma factor n=1 Tax=Erythrobacter sp. R86502 TaxID=3093846 RepID=UPI0036D324BC